MKKTPPIELDDFIKGYLHDIEFEYDRIHQPNVTYSSTPNEFVIIERFKRKENRTITQETDERFEKFIEYFEENKALELHSYGEYLELHNQDTSDHSWISHFELSDPYYDLVFEQDMYIKILDIDFIKKFRKDIANTKINNESSKNSVVSYADGVLIYKEHRHPFHKGRDKKRQLLKMFEYLWENRKSDSENIKGYAVTADRLALNIGLSTRQDSYKQSGKIRDILKNRISSLRRIFKKRFPLIIERSGTIQMIVTE